MLEALRRLTTRVLSPIAGLLVELRVSPNMLTFMSFLFALLAGYSYAVRGGIFPWSSVLLLALSGLLDVLDGALARATGRESKVGAFLDSNLDRLGEASIYTGIMLGGYVEDYLVLLALALSLVVSYQRARAEALGVSLRGVGVGERAERLLVLLVLTALSRVDLAVITVLLLSLVTMLQRLLYAMGRLSKAG